MMSNNFFRFIRGKFDFELPDGTRKNLFFRGRFSLLSNSLLFEFCEHARFMVNLFKISGTKIYL